MAAPGQSVGLLGGSFDPPHGGHILITRRAIKRLRLDRVWWMVSPGNPLKRRGPASMERRMARARALVSHPAVEVTDVEARLGSRYTAQTLALLARRYPGVRFVWLMGSDNLAQFHRWDRWRRIMATTPVAVFARPGEQVSAGLSPAARAFAAWRVDPAHALHLAWRAPPAWTLLPGPMLRASSTAIRAMGEW